MANPLPEVLIASAGMLLVLRALDKGMTQLIVFRSPWVRNEDKMFTPVAAEVIGQCVTVEAKEVVKDPGMNFGRSEHYVVNIHDHCPQTPHLCGTSADQVFRM